MDNLTVNYIFKLGEKTFSVFGLVLVISLFLFCGEEDLKARNCQKGNTIDRYVEESEDVESKKYIEKKLSWWQDARFGLFIHWGLYAQDGCFWNGQDGRSEHMMRILKIPIQEYSKIAKEFDPVDFDAEEWVKIAKDAGMKYLVITAKHHDGFAMFNSPSNDYNIVKQTPWKRDPLKELSDACKKHGIKFGVYYSLGRDWHHPHCNSIGGRRSNTWDFPNEEEKDFSIYFHQKVIPQITELMTFYKPSILWFDTPELISKEQSNELLELIQNYNPKCIVNQRIGNGLGDYAVREQKIPEDGEPFPWETCMTMSRSWGYHKTDNEWKSAQTIIFHLADIASKGGNLLLNVGPTGKGVFPEPSVKILKEIGAWLKVNGEAIYETGASPLGKFDWGRCTKKIGKKINTLYLIVFNWPQDGVLHIPQIKKEIKKAQIISTKEKLKTTVSDQGLKIKLPIVAPDEIASVIKLKIDGSLR